MAGDRRVLRAPGFVPVEAKLRPPDERPGLVLRGQLVDRLLEAADRPVVVVAAPPGYGKSVLVGQWAAEDDRPFAWLALDDNDDDPVVLLTYLALALHRVEPVPAEVLAPLAPDRASVEPALARLAAALPGRHPFVLVVDDVDALASPASHEVLRVLVDSLPPGSQVVLVGRTETPLRWEDLRVAVLRLGADDLRLTRAEVRALVRESGLSLSEDDVERLMRRTQGWAAATYLTALSLAPQQPPSAAGGAVGPDALVAAYVTDRVLSVLSPDDRRFLVRASVLATLCGPLCDAALGTTRSSARLERLARANVLLTPRDEQGRWYAVHPLLAEALRTELLSREPQLVRTLHTRAGRWYEANGDVEEALQHAIAAAELSWAARLLWQQTPGCVAAGRLPALEQRLEAFTPRQLTDHAKLALVAAWVAVLRGRPAEHWLTAAGGGHYEAAVKGEAEAVAASTALLHAVLARHGVVQMAADAMLAVRLQDPDDAWLPMARLLDGVSCYLTGRLAEARSTLADAASLASEVHDVRAVALAELALLAHDERDPEAAQVLVAQAEALVRAHGLDEHSTVLPVHCAGALLAAERGRREDAAQRVRRCSRLVALTGHPAPWGGAQCRLLLARAELALGEPVAARTLLSEAEGLLKEAADATFLRDEVARTWQQLESIPLEVGGAATTLTSAELRVLQYLPTHLSFEEIGRQLFVSRNTVKTQAVAAYRKLGVSSRADAVERAQALGLLSG